MSNAKMTSGVTPCALDEKSFLFVSYAHQDAERVYPIIENIWREGYAMWFDRGINISSTWTDEIAIAIINSSVFLAFLSKNAVESAYVRSEIEYALNKKKKIIPVYLDGMSELPPGLELGLSALQGVAGAEDAGEITERIIGALEFNKVEKTGATGAGGETRETPDAAKVKKRSVAGIIAVIVIMMIYNLFMNRGSGVKPIVLDKTEYRPAEPIFAVLPDMTDRPVGKTPIIGVSSADAPPGNFISYSIVTDPESSVALRSPMEPGRYEIRLYGDDANLTETAMTGLGDFIVSGDAYGVFNISTDKPEYAPGEEILVSVSGAPQKIIDDRAVVSLHKPGASGGQYLVYMWIGGREFKTDFDAPKEPGEYEVRAYATDSARNESTLVASVGITVTGAPIADDWSFDIAEP